MWNYVVSDDSRNVTTKNKITQKNIHKTQDYRRAFIHKLYNVIKLSRIISLVICRKICEAF